MINKTVHSRIWFTNHDRVKYNEKKERLIPLAAIPLFCRLTPARVGVEVVSGGARLNVPARTDAERRVPDLRVVALTTLLLLVDVVAGALAVMRLVVLLIVTVLKAKRKMQHESSTKKNVNTSRARTNTAKFRLTHLPSVRARCKEATIVAISEIGILRNSRSVIWIKYYTVYVERHASDLTNTPFKIFEVFFISFGSLCIRDDIISSN